MKETRYICDDCDDRLKPENHPLYSNFPVTVEYVDNKYGRLDKQELHLCESCVPEEHFERGEKAHAVLRDGKTRSVSYEICGVVSKQIEYEDEFTDTIKRLYEEKQ